jgi:hypothetical protein
LSHTVASFVFSSAESVGAALMLALQAATALCTAGLLDALKPPLEPLVGAAPDEADVDDALGVELLLLLPPQPATNVPLTTATTTSELSLDTIDPPVLHRPSRWPGPLSRVTYRSLPVE